VNGRALTSNDIKYSFENYAKTPISGYFEAVDSIQAPDASTVTIKFKEPAAYFLNVISGPSTSILPPELDEQGRRTNPIGTGPYMLKGGSYQANQEATYVRNPDYWETRDGVQLPYVDSVKTVNIPDPTTALEGFRSGQFDESAFALTFDAVDNILQSNPKTIVQIVSDHPSVIYYLGLNQQNPKWKDQRVRQALAYALDIQQIIDLALAGSATPGCLVDWASMGFIYPPKLSEMSDSLAKHSADQAKALLKQAGVDKLQISIMFPSTDTRGQAIFSLMADQLKAAGIQATADTRDAATVSDKLYGGTVDDAILTTQLPAGPDADVFTYQFLSSKGASNWFHINDPELDASTLKQRTILDPTARQAAVKDIWKSTMDKMYLVPVASPAFIRLHQPWLNNWQNMRYLDPLGWGAHIFGLMWMGNGAPNR
jgi:peptide/nickel transport system substrate-binding protein